MLVTGAGRGIGRSCAEAFASAGARVVGCDINSEAGEAVAEEIRVQGGEALFVQADVSRSVDVREFVAAAEDAYERIDILINNAAVESATRIEDTSEQEWDRVLGVNLTGHFLTCKYALPALKANRGAIVNIASMVGLVGQGESVAYTTSKGGVVAFTKALAIDLAPSGIRVNCICPGVVDTPMMSEWFDLQPDPDAARSDVVNHQMIGRMSEPEEIAAACLFLADDHASSITGIALPVDGGATLGYRMQPKS